jgi:hypothetical protein
MNQRTVPRWLGVDPAEGLELGRLVLLDEVPGNGESWFVARAFALLHEHLPDIQAVVSFADPMPRRTATGEVLKPGHIGTVYQALNARYAGRTKGRWMLLDKDRRVVSPRSLSKLRNGESGADSMERRLRAMGAPRRGQKETGAAYLTRVLALGQRDGWLVRVKHHGNHAYLFPVLQAGRSTWAKNARRRQRRVVEAGWPDALVYPRIPDSTGKQQTMWSV